MKIYTIITDNYMLEFIEHMILFDYRIYFHEKIDFFKAHPVVEVKPLDFSCLSRSMCVFFSLLSNDDSEGFYILKKIWNFDRPIYLLQFRHDKYISLNFHYQLF